MHYRQGEGLDLLTKSTALQVPPRFEVSGATAFASTTFGDGSKFSWRSDQASTARVARANRTDAESIFDRLAALKIATSNVSMHLEDAWRAGVFRELDGLLDPEEWDLTDEMPSVGSFNTFLRMVIHNRVRRRPGIGATSDGRIVAGWTAGQDRLTVQCLADDKVRWVLFKHVDGERVSNAGTSPAHLFRAYLAPYGPEIWFG